MPGMFTEMSVDQHWSCLEWNFKTALCTIHEGVRRMQEEGKGGKVVLVGSVMSLMGFAGYASYSPGKYAIRGESGLLFAGSAVQKNGEADVDAQDWRTR